MDSWVGGQGDGTSTCGGRGDEGMGEYDKGADKIGNGESE